MKTFLFTILTSLFVLQPTFAFAAVEDQYDLTSREKRILFRVCDQVDSDHTERCKVRQLRRMGYTETDSVVDSEAANGIRDRWDFGQNKLREVMQQRRLERNRALWEQERKTYSEFDHEEQEGQEVQLRDYRDIVKYMRLQCHKDVAPGRPRSLCLEQAAQNAREMMDAQRPSRQSIAK